MNLKNFVFIEKSENSDDIYIIQYKLREILLCTCTCSCCFAVLLHIYNSSTDSLLIGGNNAKYFLLLHAQLMRFAQKIFGIINHTIDFWITQIEAIEQMKLDFKANTQYYISTLYNTGAGYGTDSITNMLD